MGDFSNRIVKEGENQEKSMLYYLDGVFQGLRLPKL
jgi:hypothetical protein